MKRVGVWKKVNLLAMPKAPAGRRGRAHVFSRWSNQFEGWVSDERGPVVQPPQRLNDPDHG